MGTVKSRIARARLNLRALLVAAQAGSAAGDAPLQWFESNRAAGPAAYAGH